MKYKMLFLLLPLLASFSCGENNELKTKCPLGAPSLVFYDQGNNENFVTISGAAQIIAEFQQDKYDALVVDATSGLKQIKTYPDTPYRLAKLLTAGNLYLVSLKHSIYPSSDSTLLSFGNETSIPYYVTEKLNLSWGSQKVEYKNDVANVLAAALNDTYDYYVLAQPALNTLKSKKTVLLEEKLTIPDTVIPQAALFINKNSYNNKKDKFKNYLNDLNTRIDVCINNPSSFKESLDKYGDDSKVSTRFGFKSQIAYDVQKEGSNGFAIYPSTSKFDYITMNNFMVNVGHSEIVYAEDQFINVE